MPNENKTFYFIVYLQQAKNKQISKKPVKLNSLDSNVTHVRGFASGPDREPWTLKCAYYWKDMIYQPLSPSGHVCTSYVTWSLCAFVCLFVPTGTEGHGLQWTGWSICETPPPAWSKQGHCNLLARTQHGSTLAAPSAQVAIPWHTHTRQHVHCTKHTGVMFACIAGRAAREHWSCSCGEHVVETGGFSERFSTELFSLSFPLHVTKASNLFKGGQAETGEARSVLSSLQRFLLFSILPCSRPNLCRYLSVCRHMTHFDLGIPTQRWVQDGREGWKKERDRWGGTAAGGCHGNSTDCYTTHVNRVAYMYERERESEKRHVLRMLPRASLVNIDREDYTDTFGLLKGVRVRVDGRVCVRPPLRRTPLC